MACDWTIGPVGYCLILCNCFTFKIVQITHSAYMYIHITYSVLTYNVLFYLYMYVHTYLHSLCLYFHTVNMVAVISVCVCARVGFLCRMTMGVCAHMVTSDQF